MLDNLAVKVEAEHSKISLTLSSKDEQLSAVQDRLDAALKQLDHSKKVPQVCRCCLYIHKCNSRN